MEHNKSLIVDYQSLITEITTVCILRPIPQRCSTASGRIATATHEERDGARASALAIEPDGLLPLGEMCLIEQTLARFS